MIESLTLTGDWYLPHTSDTIKGSLKFDPLIGILLNLHGYFGRTILDPQSPCIILGQTDGGPVTLVNCVFGGGSETGPIVSSNYHVAVMFRGYHFATLECLQFTDVRFGLFNLFNWLGKRGLQYHQPVSTDGSNFSVNYEQPSSLEFSADKNCEGKIYFRGKTKSTSVPHEITVTEDCIVHLHHEQGVNYKQLVDELTIFQQWITLCTFEQSYPTYIQFSSPDLIARFTHGSIDKTWNKQIDCFFSSPYYSLKHKPRTSEEHLVSFEKMREQFAESIFLWYNAFRSMEPCFILGLRYFQDKYGVSTAKFIDQARAIEIFQRETQVEKGKRMILRERIFKLVKIYGHAALLAMIGDVDHFLEQVVINRNYYTHFTKKKDKEILEGFELNYLSNKIMLLLFRALLVYCSVPDDVYAFGLKKQFMWIVGKKWNK